MSPTFRSVLLTCLVALISVPAGRAFVGTLQHTGTILRWKLSPPSPSVHTNVVNPRTGAIRFFLAAETYSEANRTAELNAIRAAFAQWQSVPHTSLRFEEGGLFEGVPDVNTTDNMNLVFWARHSTLVNGGLNSIHLATAVTFYDYFTDNSFAEADIVLNGVERTWFTDFTNTRTVAQFAEAIVLHEIGHLIGLDHSPIGGATLFARSGFGMKNTQIGLSSDEIMAVQTLYPDPAGSPQWAQITGRITKQGAPVFGAVVLLETAEGILLSGTVTRNDGTYTLSAIPPGDYLVRVCPLDPTPATAFLVKGLDLSAAYSGVDTGFLPTEPFPITLAAAETATRHITVEPGTAPLRIAWIRPATPGPEDWAAADIPTLVHPGESNLFVGVLSADPIPENAVLAIRGDGISTGPTILQPNARAGFNLLYAPISVSPAAGPGMRSLVIRTDSQASYANGFLDVVPIAPDHNFDGLDDTFQRLHFPLFTAPEAGPSSDPDADGYTNAAEFLSGSNPTDPGSLLQIESVRLDASGSTLTWRSAAGKRYQVYSRSRFGGSEWIRLGDPVTAIGESTQFTDRSATNEIRFYRIEALPIPTGG